MRVLILLLFTALFFQGCTEPEAPSYLIRVGEKGVTVSEYQRELEVAKTAYTHNTVTAPGPAQALGMRVLGQMTDEMILGMLADEKGIAVSPPELAEAEKRIRADYPEGVFEELLLENAVSLEAWQGGLKKRLLMEKVVDETLAAGIMISPEEAAAYYRTVIGSGGADSRQGADDARRGGEVIKHLKREKAEKLYGAWMEELRKRYRVEINRQLWNEVAGAN